MSFADDYLALRNKRKKKDETSPKVTAGGNSFTDEYLALRESRTEEIEDKGYTVITKQDPMGKTFYAPVKGETEERTWFQKGAFEDGYQFGDITDTVFLSGSSMVITSG